MKTSIKTATLHGRVSAARLAKKTSRRWWPCVAAFAFALGAGAITATSVQAQTFTTLYTFKGKPDGSQPNQTNLLDVNGTLYGATSSGGVYGYGTVFSLYKGKEKVLYSFAGGADGAAPNAGLLRDKAGNLYGTAQNGGDLRCVLLGVIGCGVVFKLDKRGKEIPLYTFTGGTDGAWPQGLIADSAGNLFGITFFGGDLNCFPGVGCGVVFKVDAGGTETPLFTFTGGTDGAFPNGFLSMDSAGTLYGVTSEGGSRADCSGAGCGVVFKLDSSGTETPLYLFTGGADGASPNGSLLLDAMGNLYGTTYAGGYLACSNQGSLGCGVVFKVDTGGTETLLYTFTTPHGVNPSFGLLSDAKGNLYGTTVYGGKFNFGTVFELPASGGEKVLHNFRNSRDGGLPQSGLIMDAKGALFGNAVQGGDLACNPPKGCGTLFKLVP